MNEFLLHAMVHALTADAVFALPGEEWKEEETTFYHKYLENLDIENE